MLVNNKFKFKLDGTLYEHSQYITGNELRRVAKIGSDTLIFLRVEGADEEIHDIERVDLARFGIEHFYTVKKHPKFKLTLNEKPYEWTQFITGLELRKLGNILSDEELFLKVEGKDEKIADTERVDLARFGIEHFYSKGNHHPHLVAIEINDHAHKIASGPHTVVELKNIGHVPEGDVLAQLVGGSLIDLADTAMVNIKGCEQFYSHAQDGTSS